jgi:hypothetical protein
MTTKQLRAMKRATAVHLTEGEACELAQLKTMKTATAVHSTEGVVCELTGAGPLQESQRGGLRDQQPQDFKVIMDIKRIMHPLHAVLLMAIKVPHSLVTMVLETSETLVS